MEPCQRRREQGGGAGAGGGIGGRVESLHLGQVPPVRVLHDDAKVVVLCREVPCDESASVTNGAAETSVNASDNSMMFGCLSERRHSTSCIALLLSSCDRPAKLICFLTRD